MILKAAGNGFRSTSINESHSSSDTIPCPYHYQQNKNKFISKSMKCHNTMHTTCLSKWKFETEFKFHIIPYSIHRKLGFEWRRAANADPYYHFHCCCCCCCLQRKDRTWGASKRSLCSAWNAFSEYETVLSLRHRLPFSDSARRCYAMLSYLKMEERLQIRFLRMCNFIPLYVWAWVFGSNVREIFCKCQTLTQSMLC